MKTLIVAVLFAASSMGVRADYDRTKWGMPLVDVKKFYPGGIAETNQSGQVSYTVIKPIAGITPSVLVFSFAPGTGLFNVGMVFPKPGSYVNLKTGGFVVQSNDEAETTLAILKTSLRNKYGPPVRSDDTGEQWIVGEDHIGLLISPQGPVHKSVGLNYAKGEGELERANKGL